MPPKTTKKKVEKKSVGRPAKTLEGANAPALPLAPTLAHNTADPETDDPSTRITDDNKPQRTEDLLLLDTTLSEEQAASALLALLAGRKKLRKLHSQQLRVNSQLEFLEECHTNSTIPKGLRVNVKCHALLPDYTIVAEKFCRTKETAETGFHTSLMEHYQLTKHKLEDNIIEAEGGIANALEA